MVKSSNPALLKALLRDIVHDRRAACNEWYKSRREGDVMIRMDVGTGSKFPVPTSILIVSRGVLRPACAGWYS
jgi:hypothetical protein